MKKEASQKISRQGDIVAMEEKKVLVDRGERFLSECDTKDHWERLLPTKGDRGKGRGFMGGPYRAQTDIRREHCNSSSARKGGYGSVLHETADSGLQTCRTFKRDARAKIASDLKKFWWFKKGRSNPKRRYNPKGGLRARKGKDWSQKGGEKSSSKELKLCTQQGKRRIRHRRKRKRRWKEMKSNHGF